jgi:hypothetical protein
MPPRKRAEAAPTPEPDPTVTTGEAEAPEPAPKPAKAARRTASAPCTTCFPGGWPETSTAVGCEHGSWTRD